jgi:siroheme decarboxylase
MRRQKNEKPARRSREGEFPLDKEDRLILNEIQRNFPITHRPYLALARRLGLREKEALERVERLRKSGVIRRLGASFGARAMGFTSTLCAAKVPQDKIKDFVALVNSYPGVTHNYERDGEYNVWFTLIAPSRQRVDRILAQISRKTGIRDLLNLPAIKIFKIAVDFSFD